MPEPREGQKPQMDLPSNILAPPARATLINMLSCSELGLVGGARGVDFSSVFKVLVIMHASCCNSAKPPRTTIYAVEQCYNAAFAVVKRQHHRFAARRENGLKQKHQWHPWLTATT